MEVLFLGVGEACDPMEINTSILIGTSQSKYELLLDCGFTVPHAYYAQKLEIDDLQAIWISHFHGDHFFGLPLLLLRMHEVGRVTPITIYGPKGIGTKFTELMELAYPKCKSKFSFSVHCHEVTENSRVKIGELSFTTASMAHSQNAKAICIECGGKKIFYSGDGRPTEESIKLAQNADLIIHECYSMKEEIPGHCRVKTISDFARQARCRQLAAVHINYEIRKTQHLEFENYLAQETEHICCSVPRSGQGLSL